MFEFDDEVDFVIAWTNLASQYNFHENNWVKSVYVIKKKGFMLHEEIHT